MYGIFVVVLILNPRVYILLNDLNWVLAIFQMPKIAPCSHSTQVSNDTPSDLDS